LQAFVSGRLSRPRGERERKTSPDPMPWNDNSESGAKPGGKPGPWGAPQPGRPPANDETPQPRPKAGDGSPPRRVSPPPPPEEVSAAWRKLRRRLDPLLGPPGRGLQPRLVAGAVGLVVALWLVSGFYIVQPSEQGVVTTFGAWTRTDGPGLRYHLPAPFERAETVQVTALKQVSLGGGDDEGQMLTGDQNIVDLDFAVQWRINDAAKYLFRINDPDGAVASTAQSAIREVVGRTPLQTIMTTGRGAVQDQTRALMQKILDRYDAGITVVEVQIRAANPPPEVIQDFREVASAGQYADAQVNEANAYANRVVNEAKGDAAGAVAAAQAYAAQAVLEAQGDAARFNALEAEYRRAPAATRERLYLETMQRVLEKSNKVVIDAKGATAPIVLPPDLFKPKGQAEATKPTAAPPPPAPATPPSAGGSL
jgi:membrane protease subunit HflK